MKFNYQLVFFFYLFIQCYSSINLDWEERQMSVLLKWNITEEMDSVTILKRHQSSTKWEELVHLNSTVREYEDKKVFPIYEYYYKIIHETNQTCTYSNTVLAHCVQTCTIEGYVKLNKKIGIPGIKIRAVPKYKTHKITEKFGVTDKNGKFVIDGLPYYRGTEANYLLYPILNDEYDYCTQSESKVNVDFYIYNNKKTTPPICYKRKSN